MDTLKRQYQMLLKHISTKYVRSIYNEIEWDSRLVGIKGARGVGKTTLMLQRIKLAFPNPDRALYVTLDDIWFGSHTLVDLALMCVDAEITHIFIDEVHRLPGWERQLKNIHDLYPSISVVFTGSSLLEIDNSIADLSRRCLMYSMFGLTFREYLQFEGYEFPGFKLRDILESHVAIAGNIADKINVLKFFGQYLKVGYYPFYTTSSQNATLMRVGNMVASVIDSDIPAVENVEYATLLKAKQLLAVMGAETPSPLNAKRVGDMMGVHNNQVIKILSLLSRAQILRLLYYKSERDPKSMSKPQKVLFDNPSILHALGYANKGKERETFFASMISRGHSVTYPNVGDFMVDGQLLFEVGGAGKKFSQIKDIPFSYVVADDIEVGMGNRIPLWIFGFLG